MKPICELSVGDRVGKPGELLWTVLAVRFCITAKRLVLTVRTAAGTVEARPFAMGERYTVPVF